jgi:hypothetical protein
MTDNKQAKIVILIDFLKNDYRNIIPVVVSLRKNGAYCKIIATDRKHRKHMLNKLAINAGIPHGFLDDFCNINKHHYFKETVSIYKKKLRNLYNTLNKSRLFLYNNFSLWSNESGDFGSLIGIKRVNNILKRGIEFKIMLDMEMPDLLIFSDEQSALGKFYALTAGRKRIPYLCLPDLGDQLLQNLPVFELERKNHYAVLGKGVQMFFRRQGVIAWRFFNTGSPLADTYSFTRPQLVRGEVLGRLNLKRNKKFFLFAMQDSLPENKQILLALISAMRLFPDKYLIVRPHPTSRSTRDYRALIRAAAINNVIVSKRFKINDLISAAEMVITIYSLSGFHAIVKDKPLISINLSPFPDNMPYTEYEAALGVYKIEDLPLAMKSVLNNARTREKLSVGRKRLLRDYPAQDLDIAKNRIRDLAMSHIK